MDMKPSRMMVNPKTMRGCAEVYLRVGNKGPVPCYRWIHKLKRWSCVGDALTETNAQRWLDGEDVEMFT